MVGGGRGGKFSMLARCSVVTLVDRVPDVGRRDDDRDDDEDDGASTGRGEMGGETTAEVDDGSTKNGAPRGGRKEPITTATIGGGGGGGGLDEGLVVLYDKYVVPRGRVTDYRTEWSGITKETYNNSNNDREGSSSSGGGGGGSPAIPIVSFDQCRNEVSRLLSSIGGKRVVVVGVSKESSPIRGGTLCSRLSVRYLRPIHHHHFFDTPTGPHF